MNLEKTILTFITILGMILLGILTNKYISKREIKEGSILWININMFTVLIAYLIFLFIKRYVLEEKITSEGIIIALSLILFIYLLAILINKIFLGRALERNPAGF